MNSPVHDRNGRPTKQLGGFPSSRFLSWMSRSYEPDLPVEIVDIAHSQPGQLVAEHFGQGRVFLVGDAAHTMPPKLGLGVNTAIQSAQNLAWKLAAVLKGQASSELLSTYEAERRPVGRLASEQSLVGPAASLLTKGSDDKLLPVEKRISHFSLIGGYRYRSRAILSEDASSPPPGKGDAETELLQKPRLRLCVGQQRASRCEADSAILRPSFDHEHGGLYGVGAQPVQRFLERMTMGVL
jgi:hypothetical protein